MKIVICAAVSLVPQGLKAPAWTGTRWMISGLVREIYIYSENSKPSLLPKYIPSCFMNFWRIELELKLIHNCGQMLGFMDYKIYFRTIAKT